MTDKMISTPYSVPCRCGITLPQGAKARFGKDRLWYDCYRCRPRPASPRCESQKAMNCTCDICF